MLKDVKQKKWFTPFTYGLVGLALLIICLSLEDGRLKQLAFVFGIAITIVARYWGRFGGENNEGDDDSNGSEEI